MALSTKHITNSTTVGLRSSTREARVCCGRYLYGAPCSGSMIPDTQIGGNLTIKEVFNDKKTTTLIHSGVQA